MFKLLTDTKRKEIIQEYSMRRLIVGMSGVCAILLVGVIALSPSLIISKSLLNEAQTRIDSLNKQPTTQDAHNLVEWSNDFNKKLNLLSDSLNTKDSPYILFSNIISLKPKGIYINNFSYKVDPKERNIFIAGISEDRQTLLNFQAKLNNSGAFSKVSIPLSNYAKDKNINFEINLIPNK